MRKRLVSITPMDWIEIRKSNGSKVSSIIINGSSFWRDSLLHRIGFTSMGKLGKTPDGKGLVTKCIHKSIKYWKKKRK